MNMTFYFKFQGPYKVRSEVREGTSASFPTNGIFTRGGEL